MDENYKIWNHKSAMLRKTPGITSNQVSETLPNQTMSMAELVDRFVKGHNIPGLKNFPFDSDQPGEEILPDIAMMSKTEAAQFKLNVREEIKQQEQTLINTRKKIAIQKQQIKAATVAENQKQPSQAPQVTQTDEKQL